MDLIVYQLYWLDKLERLLTALVEGLKFPNSRSGAGWQEISSCCRIRGLFSLTASFIERMKCARQKEIDEFVLALAGKGLSIREIALLARAFFQGETAFKEQILKGDVVWGLKRLKAQFAPSACNEFEEGMLRDLLLTRKYIQRVSYKSKDQRLKSTAFFAQAALLTGQLEKQIKLLTKAIEELNDLARKA